MAHHTLFRCTDCGVVSVYNHCPHATAHTMRALSTKQANEYVRIGHDAFTRIPEPTQKAIKGLAS